MYITTLTMYPKERTLFLIDNYGATTLSSNILCTAQGGTTYWRVPLVVVLMIDPLSSLRAQLV